MKLYPRFSLPVADQTPRVAHSVYLDDCRGYCYAQRCTMKRRKRRVDPRTSISGSKGSEWGVVFDLLAYVSADQTRRQEANRGPMRSRIRMAVAHQMGIFTARDSIRIHEVVRRLDLAAVEEVRLIQQYRGVPGNRSSSLTGMFRHGRIYDPSTTSSLVLYNYQSSSRLPPLQTNNFDFNYFFSWK